MKSSKPIIKKSKSTRKKKDKRTDKEIVEELVYQLKMRKLIREKNWKKNQYKRKKPRKTSFQLLIENLKVEKDKDNNTNVYSYKSSFPKIRIKKKRVSHVEKVGSGYKIFYKVKYSSKRHQLIHEQKLERQQQNSIVNFETDNNGNLKNKKRISTFNRYIISDVYDRSKEETQRKMKKKNK
jgi:hypothetical protein